MKTQSTLEQSSEGGAVWDGQVSLEGAKKQISLLDDGTTTVVEFDGPWCY